MQDERTTVDRQDAYLLTVDRMEPEITPVDAPAALASIAVSLKRIADVLEWIRGQEEAAE